MSTEAQHTEPHCGACAFDGLMSSECQFPRAQDQGDNGDPQATPVTENYGPGCPCFRKHLKR